MLVVSALRALSQQTLRHVESECVVVKGLRGCVQISRPQVQWMAFIQETYKASAPRNTSTRSQPLPFPVSPLTLRPPQAMVNLATLGSIVSYVSGNLPSNWFSNVFVVLSVVSIVVRLSLLPCLNHPVLRNAS